MELAKFRSVDGIELQAAIHIASRTPSVGNVLLLHGITANLDEGGMFVRLADSLASASFNVLRFSFRGHGGSGGTQRGVTIAGEMLDLQAALGIMAERFGGQVSIVAASFGAVSSCLSLPFIKGQLRGMALWNPVLSLQRTFIRPELPWANKSFNEKGLKDLTSQGFLLLDGTFEIGRVLYEEMKTHDPFAYFVAQQIPSMIVHGDCDTYVSYDISRMASQLHSSCQFFTIEGSEHGFDGRKNEDKAINATISWIKQLYDVRRST